MFQAHWDIRNLTNHTTGRLCDENGILFYLALYLNPVLRIHKTGFHMLVKFNLRLPSSFTIMVKYLPFKLIPFATFGLLCYANMVTLHHTKTTSTSTIWLTTPLLAMSSRTHFLLSFWERLQMDQTFLTRWHNNTRFGIEILDMSCTSSLVISTSPKKWTYDLSVSIQPVTTCAMTLCLGTGHGNKLYVCTENYILWKYSYHWSTEHHIRWPWYAWQYICIHYPWEQQDNHFSHYM